MSDNWLHAIFLLIGAGHGVLIGWLVRASLCTRKHGVS